MKQLLERIRRYSPGFPVYLFGAVLLVRLAALARLTTSPLLLPAKGDMHFYNDWALRILRGEWTDHHAFYGLPGYAYLLAGFYLLLGYSPFIPAFLQALLESGTAVLIYHLTVRILPQPGESTSLFRRPIDSRWLGLAAGLAWAFCTPAQAYSVILMPTAWLIFVFWFVVWQLVKAAEPMTRLTALGFGVLIGLTATGIATILFLLPLLAVACFRRTRPDPRVSRAIIACGLLLVGVLLGTAPCWIHNYFVARDPVFLSAHSGINFWIGNNPEANGYPRFPPGLRAGQAAMLQDSIAGAENAVGHPLSRAAVSTYWSDKARSYIAENPMAWARLLLLKFRNFWSDFQYDDLSIITTLREQRVIFPGLSFGLIAAFAFPGMVLAVSRVRRSRWILAAIILHTAALLPVFVTERYRLPIVPGLIVFAAVGAALLWQALIDLQWQRASIYALALLCSTLFVSWPQRNPALWALDAYNSGWQALEAGDLKSADAKLQRALAYVPRNPETNFALGNLRIAQGNRAEAVSFYHTTLELNPQHGGAMNNLGILAWQDHRFDESAAWFRHAIEANPRSAKPHFLLARTLLDQGQRDLARAELESAARLEPGSPELAQLRQKIDSSTLN